MRRGRDLGPNQLVMWRRAELCGQADTAGHWWAITGGQPRPIGGTRRPGLGRSGWVNSSSGRSSKLAMRVRFPSPAPLHRRRSGQALILHSGLFDVPHTPSGPLAAGRCSSSWSPRPPSWLLLGLLASSGGPPAQLGRDPVGPAHGSRAGISAARMLPCPSGTSAPAYWRRPRPPGGSRCDAGHGSENLRQPRRLDHSRPLHRLTPVAPPRTSRPSPPVVEQPGPPRPHHLRGDLAQLVAAKHRSDVQPHYPSYSSIVRARSVRSLIHRSPYVRTVTMPSSGSTHSPFQHRRLRHGQPLLVIGRDSCAKPEHRI
jgi:hypothetical protein